MDFSRLCEYIEIVPQLETKLAWYTLTRLRAACMRVSQERGDIQPASEETLEPLNPKNEIAWLFSDDLDSAPPSSLIGRSLRTPRLLKNVLRRTWTAWNTIHGEANIDDLIVCSVIRTVSPKGFDFMLTNYNSLRSADADRARDLSLRWKRHATDCSNEIRDSLWLLVCFLFPSLETDNLTIRHSPSQSVQESAYWQRIVAESVEGEIRDQSVLGDIVEWKRSESSHALCHGLALSDDYAAVFERLEQSQLVAELSFNATELRQLASNVFRLILEAKKNNATGDSVGGFVALWRLVGRKQYRFDQHKLWLEAEIQFALKVSLSFANDLAYYWGSTTTGWFLDRDSSIDLRRSTIDWAKKHLTPDAWADILSGENRARLYYALHHFVIQSYSKTYDFDAAQWQWLPTRLMAACRIRPHIVIPHVCVLFSKETRRFEYPDDESRREVFDRELDKNLVLQLTRNQHEVRRELVQILAEHTISHELPPEVRNIVQAIKKDAQDWLNNDL